MQLTIVHEQGTGGIGTGSIGIDIGIDVVERLAHHAAAFALGVDRRLASPRSTSIVTARGTVGTGEHVF